jgi:excisionase family DNA binding protein
VTTRGSTFRMGEVADLLGASADTVRRLADAGKLRTKRNTAGHRVVDGAELARFLVAHLESPAEDVVVAQRLATAFPAS